jgi:hypothetical protein
MITIAVAFSRSRAPQGVWLNGEGKPGEPRMALVLDHGVPANLGDWLSVLFA